METNWAFDGPRIMILGPYLLEKRSEVARITHFRVRSPIGSLVVMCSIVFGGV